MFAWSNQVFIEPAHALQAPFSMPNVEMRGKKLEYSIDEIIDHWDSRVIACAGKTCVDSDPNFFILNEGCAQALAMFPEVVRIDELCSSSGPATLSKDSSQ